MIKRIKRYSKIVYTKNKSVQRYMKKCLHKSVFKTHERLLFRFLINLAFTGQLYLMVTKSPRKRKTDQ